MTNKTISALSSASTIVGTEVLPIVQSSATVKVSVANLTSGLGTIIATKGGTGQTSYSVGDIIYSDTTTTLAKLGIGAANYVLTSSGTVPQYVAQSTLSVGSATNATNTAITDNTSSSATWYPTIVSATTGNLPQNTSSTKLSFVPSTGKLTATSYGGAWAGSTIGTTYGGTGLTSFTANGVVYASSTSALATSANLAYNGTNLTITGGNFVVGTSGNGIDFSAAGGTVLTQYEQSTYTATLTGCTTSPTVTATVTIVGRLVTINIPGLSATSNSTAKTITGMPAQFRPSNQQRGFFAQVTNNGLPSVAGSVFIEASGTIDVFAGPNNDNWTASGTCTIQSMNLTFQYNV